MLPKLFGKNSNSIQSYTLSYIGTLSSCTSCIVKEVRNGEYTLELETTVNDTFKSELISQRFILAKPNPTDTPQYFEIQETKRTIDGRVKVSAVHIKNLLCQACTEGDINNVGIANTVNGTPLEVWNTIVNEYSTFTPPFVFSSNIGTAKNFSLGLSTPERFGNILAGKEGSFIDTWGGELKYNNFAVELLSSRGVMSNYKIRYGKNISDATQTESSESAYSHILPYGKISNGSTKINFFAPQIKIEDTECQFYRVFLLDCTELLDRYVVGPQGENYEEIRSVLTEYAKKYAKANDLGKITVNISVTLRAELDEMAHLSLCDTVNVVLDNFGTTAKAKITQAQYDSLLERWDKLLIGKPTVTFADLILNKRRFLQ